MAKKNDIIILKQDNTPAGAGVSTVNGRSGVVTLAKGDVGLGNVDNTSNATERAAVATLTNKSISGSTNTLTNLPAAGILGVIPIANLATGTPTGTKFVADDGTLKAPAGGGDMLAANNLSDLASIATAKVNLGLNNVSNTSDATKNAATATLTNKTIDGGSNTLTNVPASNINGVIPIANLATGTPTGSKFVADDGTLKAVPGGGDALTTNPLSQFAATTSAQLAGIMTNETGTGALVFGTGPTLNAPLGIVKGDVGLGNVDNTSDATKNSAVATLTNKTLTTPAINSPTGLVKADVGLGNVDNTSDATKNSASASLTNKKLGSLTSNGFVKTGSGDGTLSVDTAAYLPTTGVGLPFVIQVACSDLTTAITAATNKAVFRAPYAGTLTAVRASVKTAPTGSTIIIDINKNGTTVLSTKLSIDASENSSTTAASAAVISVSSFADDDEIEIDFDQVGSSTAGAGVIVTLYFTRT